MGQERKGQICTTDKGPQPAAAGGRSQLRMGDSSRAEDPEAFRGGGVSWQSSWALPGLGSRGVVVSG